MFSTSPYSNNLKPLNLNELNSFKKTALKKCEDLNNQLIECISCEKKFRINCEIEEKNYLSHLIAIHRVVIADVHLIGDFKKYLAYWKERLKTVKLDEVCFVIKTNTGANDKFDSEDFFLLSDVLPEEKELRQKLNIFKLEKVIKQLELERNDQDYERTCLFCNAMIGPNRSNLIYHMSQEHNFNIGNPDNIVFFDEFYYKLKERFDKFQCLFCEKVFYNNQVLREHMRKKMHKSIDPKNKEFDKFYIINYLEYSKVWKDIKSERDTEDKEFLNDSETIEDWTDPVQTYYCLFCDNSFENENEIFDHMINKHQFDLNEINSSNQLSFYNQVKLVNYIRRQVYSKQCFICKKQTNSMEELRTHLKENDHIKQFPDCEHWDQPEFYFSTFEDDSLLCLLDDSAYDESKFNVIPEEYEFKINSDIVNNFQELTLD